MISQKAEPNHTLSQQVDAEDQVLRDPATWDWESTEEAIVEPSGCSIIELRLPYDELAKIDQVASTQHMTVHAFLRVAALKLAASDSESLSHL